MAGRPLRRARRNGRPNPIPEGVLVVFAPEAAYRYGERSQFTLPHDNRPFITARAFDPEVEFAAFYGAESHLAQNPGHFADHLVRSGFLRPVTYAEINVADRGGWSGH